MRSLATVALMLASVPAFAQDTRYTNKLAPYVASPDRIVDRMLDLARVKPGEIVYDLGSGDGRILIAAASKYKAKAIGVEISPKLVASATSRIEQAGLAGRARVIQGNLLDVDLSDADVVTIYLATGANATLRPRLEKYLRPGARVVSHDYEVPGWKPARVDRTDERRGHVIFLYEMPPVKD